jgi:hypothetical protein
LHWYVKKLRGSSQSGLFPVRDRNRTAISDTERPKERWADHFENVLNQDRVTGKETEVNGKVCDTLNMMEDLFCEEELVT